MSEYVCIECGDELDHNEVFAFDAGYLCRTHYIEKTNEKRELEHMEMLKNPQDGLKYIIKEKTNDILKQDKEKNYDVVQKPEHYHSYEMDTITFLEKGFPLSVLKGFCIGCIVKYTQRYDKKNGIEDLEKVMFYVKKLKELEKTSK